MLNLLFYNNRTKATETLEIVHSDMNGPSKIVGLNGERYFLTFIDEFTKCAIIYCLKRKSKTARCLKHYINFFESKLNKNIKKLQ